MAVIETFICNVKGHFECGRLRPAVDCVNDPKCRAAWSTSKTEDTPSPHCFRCGKTMTMKDRLKDSSTAEARGL